ncbi:hypothetical protein Ahia01_000971400, partial [Argonauta hians]
MLKKLRSLKSRSVYDATPELSKGVWTTPDEEKDYHAQNPANLVICDEELVVAVGERIGSMVGNMVAGMVPRNGFVTANSHQLTSFHCNVDYSHPSSLLTSIISTISFLCHFQPSPIKAEHRIRQTRLTSLPS